MEGNKSVSAAVTLSPGMREIGEAKPGWARTVPFGVGGVCHVRGTKSAFLIPPATI